MFGLLDARLYPCVRCCASAWRQHKLYRMLHTALLLAQESGRHYYEVLGLKPNATSEQIREAFVKISKEIHPDRNPSDASNHDKFVQLNEAYSVLSKERTRRAYDTSLMVRAVRHQAGPQQQSSWPDGLGDMKSPQYSGNESQMFWDETIWYMRDRTKDSTAFYDENQYYGVKGIGRLSNSVIVAGCVLFIGLGLGVFFVRLRYMSMHSREAQDKLHQDNIQHLELARANAKMHGTERQLEILQAQVQAKANLMHAKTVNSLNNR